MTTEISKECRWCGMRHGTLCPAVKSIEYFADGTVKKVEFKDYPSVPAIIPYPVPYPVPSPIYSQPRTPPFVPWLGTTCSVQGSILNTSDPYSDAYYHFPNG